ncbi:NUMOD4 motif-containing HNH endonuclease [uncultured Bifidobacterium sp.]|uniref:NUMOD4 motif-containing HNH endonuclease n=1 Tax=uncultured Bifidobacterium sp. TaxID=165187 RepID=UPI00261E80DA|nr:NUMOD4 motif-containing HNH endonuclease [uncultured Bifidobacterium sp.]
MSEQAMTIDSITTEPIKNYTSLPGELWMPISGTGSRYYVSNMGRVLSSIYYSHPQWALLKPYKTGRNAKKGKGYLQVKMYVDGKKVPYKVHRLVADHFIPNPDGKPQVNHKNMDTLDNRVDNLEWCTNTENQQHARAHQGKLNWDKVNKLRQDYEGYQGTKEEFCRDMALAYRVTRNCIRFALDRKTWS